MKKKRMERRNIGDIRDKKRGAVIQWGVGRAGGKWEIHYCNQKLDCKGADYYSSIFPDEHTGNSKRQGEEHLCRVL